MLEFIEDVTGYKALHSSARQVAVVNELLQEVQGVDHVLRQIQLLVPGEKRERRGREREEGEREEGEEREEGGRRGRREGGEGERGRREGGRRERRERREIGMGEEGGKTCAYCIQQEKLLHECVYASMCQCACIIF